MAPGLTVHAGPPAGWDQLIIKCKPRLADGEGDKLHAVANRLATLLTTVIVADVVGGPSPESPYELGTVAIGLSTPIRGVDTIVTSTTRKELGAELGMIGGIILSQTEARLSEIKQVAGSKELAIVDAPAIVYRGGAHVDMIFRYVILLDARSGQLHTLLLVISGGDQTGAHGRVETTMRWLAPNLVEDCQLHIDSNQIVAGIPNSRTFAVMEPPPGIELAVPQPVLAIAGRSRLDPAALDALEYHLRAALQAVQLRGIQPRAQSAQPPRG